ATARAATVYGTQSAGVVDARVRSTRRLEVSPATRDLVIAKLLELKPEVEERFGVALERCEEPQFLHYQAGDFFVAHQDGNTPLIRDDTRHRKVSVVIFLSDPGTYEGGSLVLHDHDGGHHAAPAERG